MGIAVTIFAIILLLVSFFLIKEKYRATNPLFFFLALWCLILFLSIFNLFGLDPATDISYILLLTMIASFTVGYCVHAYFKKSDKQTKKAKTEKASTSSVELPSLRDSWVLKILLAIIVISIVLNLIDYFIGLHYIVQGFKPWQIRNWTLAPYGSSNPILDRRSFVEELFRAFIASPLALILPAIAAFYYFTPSEKKTRYSLLVLSLVSLVSSSLAGGGGRIEFIYYIGCFALAYFTIKKRKVLRKDLNTKRILLIGAACVLSVVGLTVFRTSLSSIFKQIYVYFALPPSLLSKWLPGINAAGFTFGLTTLFGVHSPVFRAIKTVGLSALVPTVYALSESNVFNAEVYMGMSEGAYNAFVTPVYYFMHDGGIIAVVLFSAIFGFLCSYVYQKYQNNFSLRTFILYILMFYGVFVSFSRIQTVSPAYILAIVFAFLVTIRFKHVKK